MPSYRVVSVRIRVAMCRLEGEFFGFCHSSKGTLNDENATGQCVVKLEKTLAIEIPGIFEFSWCLTSVPQVLSVDSISRVVTHSSPTLIWRDFLNHQIGRPGRYAIFRRDELEMGSSLYQSVHLQPRYKVRLMTWISRHRLHL
ncbi:hypothetical protein PGTUg99_005374 [Puccinia graminis f. sp. tritici]|uniref:Uncharacterized protein n=1 Tax=Puccinia graminis f. sp. tritici TaxID=56615 RepID=A0A5B0MZX5_PUCGR|nr:hypothetical protein PGTUg99_005374 [Puccinia graminis f. sp. tritici]